MVPQVVHAPELGILYFDAAHQLQECNSVKNKTPRKHVLNTASTSANWTVKQYSFPLEAFGYPKIHKSLGINKWLTSVLVIKRVPVYLRSAWRVNINNWGEPLWEWGSS